MNDPFKGDPTSLIGVWSSISSDIKILGLAGFAGAVCNALLLPKGTIRQKIVAIIVGFLSAVFLGGLVVQIASHYTEIGGSAKLGIGFVIGNGGQIIIEVIQNKLRALNDIPLPDSINKKSKNRYGDDA